MRQNAGRESDAPPGEAHATLEFRPSLTYDSWRMSSKATLPVAPEAGEIITSQVERILQSDTFRSSEALRRLLRFLAEKTVSGEADQLKEYSVGIDALGKSPEYDPRHASSVRIQVSRLRQKLGEYYRSEGTADTHIIDLPKGRFKLTCEARPSTAPTVERAETAALPWRRSPWFVPTIAGLVLLVAAVAWAAIATTTLWRERQTTEIFRATWTPELEQLWRPVFSGNRPLLISIADPPFVQFKGHGAYRDLSLNRWDDIIKSPDVVAIRKALGNADVQPSVYYAPMGEVSASFLIGRLLGPRVPALSLVRASELSWQQLADNNVLYIGAQVFFAERMNELPARLDLVYARGGIRNDRPAPGEEHQYLDQTPTGPAEDGEVYALVTHLPGPRGATEITSFNSNRTPGRLAAVDWFTDPMYARTLVARLRKPSGEIPRYYQVVLRVKFKDGVPTSTSYVLHHELTADNRSADSEPRPYGAGGAHKIRRYIPVTHLRADPMRRCQLFGTVCSTLTSAMLPLR